MEMSGSGVTVYTITRARTWWSEAAAGTTAAGAAGRPTAAGGRRRPGATASASVSPEFRQGVSKRSGEGRVFRAGAAGGTAVERSVAAARRAGLAPGVSATF